MRSRRAGRVVVRCWPAIGAEFAAPVSGRVRLNVSGAQRLLLQSGDLLAQLEDAILPVSRRIEPWEGDGEGGIRPAAREPCRVVDEAERAQRFHEIQLAVVELGEVL